MTIETNPKAAEPIYLEQLRTGPYVGGAGHVRMIGLELVSVARGEGCLKCPWRAELAGDEAGEIIASGVIATLIDHAGGLAVLASLTEPGFTATMDLRIDTLRSPAPRKDIYARAKCVGVNGQVAFVAIEAFEDDPEDLVALAQATFVLTPVSAPMGDR